MSRTNPAPRARLVVALSLSAVIACLSGCAAGRGGAPRVTKAVSGSTDFNRSSSLEKIGDAELDELTNAFADRYRTLLEDAVSAVVTGNPDARQRSLAQRFLVETTSSAYDIVTNGDPFSQVLDLTIMVTLTSQVWIDDDRATREFGEVRGEPLVASLRRAREEAWDITARVFTPDQLSALDFLIAGWRRANTGVEDVSFVRFGDFAEARGQSVITEVAQGGGLFQPINQAVDEAVAYRKLLERMFYLAKRAPTLINWQSQSVIDQVLAKEETIGALRNLDSVTGSVDELGKTVSRLGEDIPRIVASEREAIFKEIDRLQDDVQSSLAEVRVIAEQARVATTNVRAVVDGVAPALGEAQKTLDAAQPTLAAVERLAGASERILGQVAEMSGPPNPDAKPFDIAEYRGALVDATATLSQANTLIERGESLASSPAVRGIIDEVTEATEQRIASLEEAVTRIVWLIGGVGAALVLFSFTLLGALRYLPGAPSRQAGGAA
jgi:hypothetical protein